LNGVGNSSTTISENGDVRHNMEYYCFVSKGNYRLLERAEKARAGPIE
jgi:hypothetical protein